MGGGLPREGVGAKKFGTSLETREIKLFWWDIPGFCRDIPAVPEKFEKKRFVFNLRSLFVQDLRRQKSRGRLNASSWKAFFLVPPGLSLPICFNFR